MSNETAPRKRWDGTIAAETHDEIKKLKVETSARSESAVVDEAIKYYRKGVDRLKK